MKPIKNFVLAEYPKGSVTQWYGENPALYALWGLSGHNGIDIVAPHGEPLLAVEDGIIISVKNDPKGFGKHVRMLSVDREWTCGHCDSILVKVGDFVKEGTPIAKMGNTGFVQTLSGAQVWWGDAPDTRGTHCHLGLREVALDPNGFAYPKSDIKIRVLNYDNGMKGAIDPKPFLSIPLLKKLVELLTLLKKK
jgi:murein DD-endopeptidase MepM/ murein hydrolase activator NlpD